MNGTKRKYTPMYDEAVGKLILTQKFVKLMKSVVYDVKHI